MEETGYAFSRYTVKLSSRQTTSGCVDPAGKDGARGELVEPWVAVEMIPHIGHPGLGAYSIGRSVRVVAGALGGVIAARRWLS